MSHPWFKLAAATAVFGLLLLVVHAQETVPGKGPPPDKGKKGKLFEGPGAGGPEAKGVLGSLFEALDDKKVQDEIELSPEQKDELRLLGEKIAQELQPKLQELKGLPKHERDQKIVALRGDLQEFLGGLQRDVDKVLLPHQQKLLRQAMLQHQLRHEGVAGALRSSALLSELNLSEADATRLQTALTKIEAEFRRKEAALHAETRQQILAEFSPSQRERLGALLGKEGEAPFGKRPPPGAPLKPMPEGD